MVIRLHFASTSHRSKVIAVYWSSGQFSIREITRTLLCNGDPWIYIRKISNPFKRHFLGWGRMAQPLPRGNWSRKKNAQKLMGAIQPPAEQSLIDGILTKLAIICVLSYAVNRSNFFIDQWRTAESGELVSNVHLWKPRRSYNYADTTVKKMTLIIHSQRTEKAKKKEYKYQSAYCLQLFNSLGN